MANKKSEDIDLDITRLEYGDTDRPQHTVLTIETSKYYGENNMETKLGPIRELGCCCCGNSTRGRQWWNRDTGYGICKDCIAYVRKHGESEAEIKENYGIEGIHWGIEE